MKVIKLPIMIMMVATLLLQSSCTSIMDPEAAELKTNVKQLNPRAKVRPVSKKDMVVFVRYRNSSGSVLDVRESVMNEIRSQGYRIVDDVDKANFTLVADLRYVGHKTHESYGHTIFGALIGAVAGAVIGHQIGDGGTTEQVVGGAAGAILGGIAGKAIDNRNRIVTVDMVVDISLGERIEGGVSTSRKTAADSAINHNSQLKSTGSTGGGRSSSSYSEKTEFTQRENFIYHENRFIATATKLKLTYGEAQSALSGQISRAIANSLP